MCLLSLSRNVDPADHERSVARTMPRLLFLWECNSHEHHLKIGSQQLVQWLSVQADHMAGSLQQNVRALMVRASSPKPSSDRHQDEVARLRAQLQHSKRVRLVLMSATGDHNLVRERIPHCHQLVTKGVMHKVRRCFLEQPLDKIARPTC